MYRNGLKRLLDTISALFFLIAFSPVFLAIAAAIKLGSSGPVFFRQERGGKNGKYFKIFKFRSMAVDLEAEKKGFEPGTSKRITGIGRILRKTKLDELPQLINVLKGEMSFVGPRPEVRKYIEIYPERWKKTLSVTPGITDPASIRFRNEEEILAKAEDPEKEYRDNIMPQKLDIYEEYTQNITFANDIKLIFATFIAVFLK
jgi:lipopolysaccharide/colanic/teichoic acid biosynthesis glycosyltransferase